MDVGLRTPLLDFFRRGEALYAERLLAAQGEVAPGPIEQMALLAMLIDDADAHVRRVAEATLAKIPRDAISAFIGRRDVPGEMREFFVARGVVVSPPASDSTEQVLVNPDPTDYGPEPQTEDEKLAIVQRLAAMSVPERVRAAMKGGREMRAILIRDPNKLVALSVLSSPKMTEAEIESIARMGTVSEDVLRTIAQNRSWTKNYTVVLALVKNSKTPLTYSLTLLNRLVDKDIKGLLTNRNIPETLRLAARKKIARA